MGRDKPDQKIMVMNRDRMYYYGLMGKRMHTRRMGALSIYLAPEGKIRVRLGNGGWQVLSCVAVPPSVPHQIDMDCQKVINLLIEPERIEPAALDALCKAYIVPSDDQKDVARIRSAADLLKGAWANGGLDTIDFDQLILGRALPERKLDSRVELILERLEEDFGDAQLSAETCADIVGLSVSRFLHLFKDETGIPLRNLRMWKRGRRFLEYANGNGSLTDVALDLGYPDSSHFSHSIRRIYGWKPRSIRIGSQGLLVLQGDRQVADRGI